jgi:hypothetical protein
MDEMTFPRLALHTTSDWEDARRAAPPRASAVRERRGLLERPEPLLILSAVDEPDADPPERIVVVGLQLGGLPELGHRPVDQADMR